MNSRNYLKIFFFFENKLSFKFEKEGRVLKIELRKTNVSLVFLNDRLERMLVCIVLIILIRVLIITNNINNFFMPFPNKILARMWIQIYENELLCFWIETHA